MEVPSNKVIEKGIDAEGKTVYERLMAEATMYQCDVLYRKGKILCTGYGSTKRQAERNAGVMGLRWQKEHPEFRKKELREE